MKSLEEALKGRYCHVNKDWDCDNCPYEGMDACVDNMSDDLYLNAIKLKEENERLTKCRDSENNKDEVIKCLSDTNKDLLKYIHELKEDNKLLKEDNKEFIEQIFRMRQSM